MHLDEIDIDESLVSNLIASQFPDWLKLPIKRVASAGTDNALFRLGDDLVVRLPRIPSASEQIDKECEWLPKLAPHLPLTVPVPLKKGTPCEDYPCSWSVCNWIEGKNGNDEQGADLNHTAKELAGFIRSLHAIAKDPADGPPPGEHNFWRGVPLQMRDSRVREAIEALKLITDSATSLSEASINSEAAISSEAVISSKAAINASAISKSELAAGQYDPDLLGVTWESLLSAPEMYDPPGWIHGDLQAGNLLFVDGQLRGVIDFGGLAIGDPACDLMPAWTIFHGESRETFRSELNVDDGTWARGRGWAFSVALIALPYYWDTNPTIVHNSRKAIDAVLNEIAET
jgi:Predicted aminoglycoside phosphotransferase